jgi:GABA(A) receptor-associated protein
MSAIENSSNSSKYNNINTIESPQFTRKKIEQLLSKHPDRIPIVISSVSHKIHGINRFIVPLDMTVGGFMTLLRKKVELSVNESIFIFVKKNINSQSSVSKGDILAPTSATLGSLYEQHKDDKLVLNLAYEKENVFG